MTAFKLDCKYKDVSLCLFHKTFSYYISSNTLRVWELDVENRKIRPTEVGMGQLKRIVKCIQVSDANCFPVDKSMLCLEQSGLNSLILTPQYNDYLMLIFY